MKKSILALALATCVVGLVVHQPAAGQPTTYVEAALNPGAAAPHGGPTGGGIPPAPAKAAAVFSYTDRAVFDAAFPGLPVEDFEAGDAAPGAFLVCDAPLDAAGDVPCGFAAGEILGGIAFQDNPGPDAGSLILLGSGTSLNPSRALVTNTFVDAFDVLFNPAVTVAGMDLHSTAAPGAGDPDLVTIQLFDSGGVLVGTFASVDASGPGNFWGFTSDVPIGRVSILSANNRAEGVDNVAFGAAFGLSGIPALGGIGLLALAAVLGAAAIWVIRFRSA